MFVLLTIVAFENSFISSAGMPVLIVYCSERLHCKNNHYDLIGCILPFDFKRYM